MTRGKSHRWVREVKCYDDGYVVIWCADCGVHRGDVADWEKDPVCPGSELEAERERGEKLLEAMTVLYECELTGIAEVRERAQDAIIKYNAAESGE